jgi:formylglycine-generating enzyme required for sulfatase activity
MRTFRGGSNPFSLAAVLFAAVVGVAVAGARATEPIKTSIGLELIRIPDGEFTMGSPKSEKGRRADEPERRVRITRDYYLGRTEVTRGEFRSFVEATGYRTDAERGIRGGYGVDPATLKLLGPDKKFNWQSTGFEQSDDHPVVNVTWNDAVAFCRWLGEKEKAVFRLPTEAEWEYACRAGTTTAFAVGDDPEGLVEYANIVDARAKEKYPDRSAVASSDGFVFTAPTATFKPNAWGLYDMHGNVWEWTNDWFAPPAATDAVDPRGPDTGRDKVIRGGDWYHDWSFARSAQRYPIHPSLCRRHAGFRVVRE